MKSATESELAAVLWKFCTEGINELRVKISRHIPGYEKQTLFGPSSKFFESASLHLCLAMAAVCHEPKLQSRLFETCLDYIRGLGATMFEMQKFLGMLNERRIDYTAAMQRRQGGDEGAFSQEVVEHLAPGDANDPGRDDDLLLHLDCNQHLDAFLPGCIALRSEYNLVSG